MLSTGLFVLALTLRFTYGQDPYHPQFATVTRQTKLGESESQLEYWQEQAQQTVSDKIKKTLNENVAKNVIMFLGDGMSIPTIAAARMALGGEEQKLAFDKFPWSGLSMTYAVDRQVADSANTATAYLCGVKANYGTIGVGPEVPRRNCQAQANTTHHVFSIAYHSQTVGKSTGLVTTARVTHASPAGVFGHTANRDWEADSDVENDLQDPSVCTDLAAQLVYGETGKNLDVILGGGRKKFIPQGTIDEEGQEGSRSDGVNLIEEWLKNNANSSYVWNKSDLLDLDPKTEKLLGLFSDDHLEYNLKRDTDMDPSLEEMTEAAIKILNRNENGFFLFVEGARIDMAHHDTKVQLSLDETLEFSKAIQKAVDLTSEEDTLIVVTSDHSHTLSYNGYATRGNDILGFPGKAGDGKPYFTLSYANGPGYRVGDGGLRPDHTDEDYKDIDYRYPAVAPLSSETHGGDDVGIFARGPNAHLFSGVMEQNVIPHLMEYASCVGEGLTVCTEKSTGSSSAYLVAYSSFIYFVCVMFALLFNR